MKIKVKEVFAYEGNTFHYTDECGYPAGIPVPCIEAIAEDDKTYHLPQSVKQVYDEEGFGPYIKFRFDLFEGREVVRKIHDNGNMIDTDNWIEFWG